MLFQFPKHTGFWQTGTTIKASLEDTKIFWHINPENIKKSVIIGWVDRDISHNMFHTQNIKLIESNLFNNNYPITWLKKIIKMGTFKLHRNINKTFVKNQLIKKTLQNENSTQNLRDRLNPRNFNVKFVNLEPKSFFILFLYNTTKINLLRSIQVTFEYCYQRTLIVTSPLSKIRVKNILNVNTLPNIMFHQQELPVST